MAENEIDRAHQEGLPVITIRPRALFGPGDRTIFPRLLRANQKGSLPLINHGKVLLDVTYVENVVDALLLCAKSGESTLGKKYNITNGDPIYLVDFLTQLLDRLGESKHFKPMSYPIAYAIATLMEWAAVISKKEPVLTRYTVGVLSKNQTLDIRAAQSELGYVPQISIAEGIERFATWWESASCLQ
jgi:nucleoside-diphosphate-sugar epimerase